MTFDFATLERPKSPNTYLLAPEGLCEQATPDEVAPVFPQDPDTVFLNLKAAVERDGQLRDIAADDAARTVSAIAVTKLFKFKDDLDAVVLPAPEGATLAVYSRSRVGYGDMGANKKRVNALIAALREGLARAEGRVA